MMHSPITNKTETGVAILLFIVLYFALAYGIYTSLTLHVLGANDFFSRWEGARALFLRGENPYSDSVTQQIQLGMYGRLASPDEDQVAFAYPLYAAFVAAPIVNLPYAQAQALWMAWLIVAVIGGAFALMTLNRISIRAAATAGMFLGVLVFYPATRGIFNGQFALVSFLCLGVAFWAIEQKADILAGLLLAFATVKPQTSIFLVPLVVGWAIRQRRLGIVFGAIGSLTVLVVISFMLVPTWLIDFVMAMQKYTEYEHVGPPIQTLSEWLVPNAWFPVTLLIGLILIAWMVGYVAHTIDLPWKDFQPTVGLVALITTLIAGRVGTPDQILLLIMWLYWLAEWLRRKQYSWAIISAFLLLVVPWLVFQVTRRGDSENVAVTLVLPGITLVAYIWSLIPRSRLRENA
jgi:hypothetical protein